MFKNNSSRFYMSLFIENMIKLYEESGNVNYHVNDFLRKIYPTLLESMEKPFPRTKINKNK